MSRLAVETKSKSLQEFKAVKRTELFTDARCDLFSRALKSFP